MLFFLFYYSPNFKYFGTFLLIRDRFSKHVNLSISTIIYEINIGAVLNISIKKIWEMIDRPTALSDYSANQPIDRSKLQISARNDL